jgi:excisionase family DNA binding protein
MPPVLANIQPLLVSIIEAAQLLEISRSSLYYLIVEGDLKAVKIGARTLVRRADAKKLADHLPLATVNLWPRGEARKLSRGRPPAVNRKRPTPRR